MIRNNKGNTTIIIAVAMIILLGITALVTDIGLYFYERSKITNAVDAAALAGAQVFYEDALITENIAKDYFEKNGFDRDKVEINISESEALLTVEGIGEFDYFFARVLGLYKGSVAASAKAMLGPITSIDSGVRPMAIMKDADEELELEFGTIYVLKGGAGGSNKGNYGAIALGGRGTAVYLDNIKFGFSNRLSVGDLIDTEPGNMSTPTINGVNYIISQCTHEPRCTQEAYVKGCQRVITIPIVNFKGSGRTEVEIVGFAAFFIEDVEDVGGQTEILGSFVQHIAIGDIGSVESDYGLRGIKLVR